MYEEIKYNKELAKTFSKETRNARREEYIVNNIPFAGYVSKKIKVKSNGFFDEDDILQESIIGVIKSVDYFNFDYGVQFSTYAYQNCFGSILRFMRDNNNLKVSRELYQLGNQIYSLSSQGFSDDEIIEMVGEENFLRASSMRNSLNLVNLDSQISGRDGRPTAIGDLVADNRARSEDSICNDIDLNNAMNRLNEKEKLIVEMYYFQDITQSTIAAALNTSQVQVSRILKKALKKLKEELTHDE